MIGSKGMSPLLIELPLDTFPSHRVVLRAMWMSRTPDRFAGWRQSPRAQLVALALLLGSVALLSHATWSAAERTKTATARLNTAAERLNDLTHGAPADDHRRAAIAWGYAQRLRLGLESSFRLIESASRDPRLTPDERRTVAWALLAHVLSGETHEVDPAVLDGLSDQDGKDQVAGEQHLALIDRAISVADDPRAAELAVRFAYTLGSAERIVDAFAPPLVAGVAALIADRELARREAAQIIQSARGEDPISSIRERRSRRAFYLERPALLAPNEGTERAAITMSEWLLDSLRAMRPAAALTSHAALGLDAHVEVLAPRLYAAGAQLPPVAPLAVTVKRHLPLVRAQAPRLDDDALARTRNAEMLVAVTRVAGLERGQRKVLGRLLVAAAVSMRTLAQQPVWFPGDSAPSARQVAASLGLASVAFDPDVPGAWRPFFLRQLSEGVADLRRVLPAFTLDSMRVRFRMSSPADSALAMHDPRTRTLHLPVFTAGGTLTHELAHDLDRQQAVRHGHAGYRSDFVARNVATKRRSAAMNTRIAASLRALTEELSELPRTGTRTTERPAEIFATRVDWFVAAALASEGISSGFLSAVQDELLTGHVVHPERLRTTGRSRSLLTALEGMTAVAPFAAQEREPSIHTLLRWSLAGPVDRAVAATIVRGAPHAWSPVPLIGGPSCAADDDQRVRLMRMAAESRARGWLRWRARWTSESPRPAWAHSALGRVPWSEALAERRVDELRDYILVELSSSPGLPAGLPAYAATLAARARCG